MSSKQDLLLRLDSEFNDKGFKSAADSARVLERELDKQEAAERRLANLQIAAAREDQQRRAAQLMGMEQLGRGFTAVGLLAAAGLGVAAKAAVDWESAWAGVTKTVDGTPEQMAALEKELRNLATTLPATHEEIAGVAEAAGQLGVKRQDVAAFTKTMIDLGVSTNLSADEAATSLAQISNVMGTMNREGTAGIQRLGATLVALGNAGASTEKDIVDMSARIAGAGKIAGLTESDVLALANAMSSVGIESQLGGSAMSRVLLTINSAAIEGGASVYRFAKVAGMSADEFSQKWKTAPAQAVNAFVQGLARVSAEGGDAATTLKTLGLRGTENASVMLRLAGSGDLLTQSLELGNEAWKANSALLAEANKRYETTESRLKTARNQLNDVAIDLGANVLPALADTADKVGALATAFGMLPDPVKEGIVVLGGIVATAGLLGGAALMLIPKLAAMNATLAASGPAGARAAAGLSAAGRAIMGPWGLALGAATVALTIFAEQQGEAKQRAQELAETLDKQTGALTESSRALVRDKLFDDDVLRSAEQLGLSLQDVVDASLGLEDPLRRVNTALAEANQRQIDMGSSGQGLAGTALDLANNVTKVRDAVNGGNKDIARAREEYRLKASAMGEDAQASDAASEATKALSSAQADNAQSTEDARKELEDLVKAVEGYGDTVNAALDATSGYEAAIDDATEALKKNGATANKARTAIDLHTEAGRANDKALRKIAESALEAATANFQNGKSVKSVTSDVVKARAEFITMATKMGLSKKAAGDLANQLGLTKSNVGSLNEAIRQTPTSKTVDIHVQTKEALAKLAAFQSRINNLRGNDVRVNVRYVTTGQTGGGITKDSAAGNLFEYSGSFARGGYAPIGGMQPQLRLAGGDGLRWSERGAGPWEAFISGNPAKRDRSMAIWEDTGRRLGAFEPMRSQPAVMVEGAKTIDRSMHVTAYGHSADDVARAIRRDQAKQAALHPEFGG